MAEDTKEISEIEKIKKNILELSKQEEALAEKKTKKSQKELETVREQLKAQKALLKLEKEKLIEQKEQLTFAKSFVKINDDVKKLLKDQNSETSIYKSIGDKIAKSKAKQQNLSKEELHIEMERESYLSDINSSLLQQAQSAAKAEADARGLTEFDMRRAEIKQNSLKFSEAEVEELLAAIDLLESIYKR
jgi:hypothetical protein